MNYPIIQFDFCQLLGNAWEVLKKNLSPLIGGFLVYVLLLSVGNVVYIGGLIISGPLMFGLFRMSQLAIRGESIDFMVLFSGFQRFLDCFLANLLISVFTVIGGLFCILPGLLIAVLYMPAYLFIIDRNQNFWEAMESSRQMVMANLMPWILLAIILWAINLAGVMCCCIGWVVTGPLSFLVITMAYEQACGSMPNTDPIDIPVTPEAPVE